MYALLRWILSALIAFAALLFALANRDDIAVVWSPVHDAVSVPVFLPVLCGLLAGFVCGGLFVWLSAAPLRRERRQQRREITKLEKNLRESEARAALIPSPASGLLHE